MGKSRTGFSGQADFAEEVGLDWTHPGTRRGREREAGLPTVGGKTLRRSSSNRATPGLEQQQRPRDGWIGGVSSKACARLFAMGLSKYI